MWDECTDILIGRSKPNLNEFQQMNTNYINIYIPKPQVVYIYIKI